MTMLLAVVVDHWFAVVERGWCCSKRAAAAAQAMLRVEVGLNPPGLRWRCSATGGPHHVVSDA